MLSKKHITELTRISNVINNIDLVEILYTYDSYIRSMVKGDTWSGSTFRKVSIPDIMEKHLHNMDHLECMRVAYEVANKELTKAQKILSQYKKCHVCKGNQGAWANGNIMNGPRPYTDCENCDGHGYVKK